MRFYLTSLLVLLLGTCVRAQIDNFQPAVLTLANGSTLNGYANADGSLALSRRVRFRAERSDGKGEQRYSPRQVSGLVFTDIKRTYRTIQYRWTPTGAEEPTVEPRLAELLYDGTKYDLLTLERASNEYFDQAETVRPQVYYLSDGTVDEPLEIIQRLVEGQTRNYNLVEAYRGRLRYFLRDWPRAEAAIKRMRYTDAEMIGLLRDYDQFLNPDREIAEVSRESNSYSLATRLLFSPMHRYAGKDDANQSAFGGGVYATFTNILSGGTASGTVGLEALSLGYDKEVQFNRSFQTRWMAQFRVPAFVNVYLSNQGKIKPRLRGGATGVLSVAGVTRFTFFDSGESTETYLDVSWYGGAGADYGRMLFDLGYDTFTGLTVGVGVRLNQPGQ